MAEFLDANGISAALTDLFKYTRSELFLVTPYIQLGTQVRNYLSVMDNPEIHTVIIFRKDEPLKPDDKKFIDTLPNTAIYATENLHAKCYLNEDIGIIASMNLYAHSQHNNWEMGVKFSKETDASLYQAARKEIELILKRSKLIFETGTAPAGAEAEVKAETKAPATGPKSTGALSNRQPGRQSGRQPYNTPAQNNRPQKLNPKLRQEPRKGFFESVFDKVLGEAGFCIRCGEGIEYNPEQPYCEKCFKSWSRYKNVNYRENYCHKCGAEWSTTKVRPVCNECFDRYFR